MNILLIDQPLWNRGDESAHKGLIRNLIHDIPDVCIKVLEFDVKPAAIIEFDMRLPQVHFVNLHSYNKAWFDKILGNAYKFHLGWILFMSPTMMKVIKLYKEADLIMMAPGGINLGGFQDWRHLSLLLLALKMKKPLVYYGRSIGPFGDKDWKQRRFKKLANIILKNCNFICLRDRKSLKVATDLHISCVSTVDSAFLDSTEVQIPDEVQRIIDGGQYIVFVPNELIWHYTYRNKISVSVINDFYTRLVEVMQKKYPDYKIVMLPQTNNQKRNDYDYFCELRSSFPIQDNIIVIPDIYSSDVQQAVIKQAMLMVGARYHSIVFAINQGIPFVSLSYEHKMSGLLETLDETSRMIDISKIFANHIAMESAIARFEYLIADLRDSQNARTKAKKIARQCFELYMESLSKYKKLYNSPML